MANSGLAIQVSQQLVTEECVSCHTLFAVTSDLRRRALDEGLRFFCPLGHGQSYMETTVAKLEKEKATLARQLDVAKQEARAEMFRREQAERKGKRLEKRIRNGVCIHCKRHFVNVERHMKSRHPENEK